MAVYDVMRAGDPADAARLAAEFHQALAGHRFGAVIVDKHRSVARRRFGARRTAGATGPSPIPARFWPVTGRAHRPEWIYLPR